MYGVAPSGCPPQHSHHRSAGCRAQTSSQFMENNMTSPKHLKLFVVALAALAVGGGCGDPVDPAGDMVPAGDLVPEEATYRVPPIGQREVLDSCLLYTSPSPRDRTRSRMPSSA